MVTIAKNSIFNLQASLSLYNFNVERNFTILQGQILGRADYDIRKFNLEKTGELSSVQTRLDVLLKQKDEIADRLGAIRNSRDQLSEVRNALAAAGAAAKAGDRIAFDSALLTVNLEAGSSRTDKDNLIGALSASGRGARSEVISTPNGDVLLQTRALTTGYSIALSTGESITPEAIGNYVKIDGTKHDLPGLSYVSSTGDDITFDAGGTTYSGTVSRGGLGVLNSFVYGDLPSDASAASQAFRDQAVADVKAALKIVDGIARNLDSAEIEVARGAGQIDIDAGATQTEMNDLVLSQREEEFAFNRALQTRTQVALSSIALAAQSAQTQITAMFTEEPEYTNTILDSLGMFKDK